MIITGPLVCHYYRECQWCAEFTEPGTAGYLVHSTEEGTPDTYMHGDCATTWLVSVAYLCRKVAAMGTAWRELWRRGRKPMPPSHVVVDLGFWRFVTGTDEASGRPLLYFYDDEEQLLTTCTPFGARKLAQVLRDWADAQDVGE